MEAMMSVVKVWLKIVGLGIACVAGLIASGAMILFMLLFMLLMKALPVVLIVVVSIWAWRNI